MGPPAMDQSAHTPHNPRPSALTDPCVSGIGIDTIPENWHAKYSSSELRIHDDISEGIDEDMDGSITSDVSLEATAKDNPILPPPMPPSGGMQVPPLVTLALHLIPQLDWIPLLSSSFSYSQRKLK